MAKVQAKTSVGREHLVSALSAGASISADQARGVLQVLFGTGGSGTSGGDRNPGIIEGYLMQGHDVAIRGFGSFRFTELKAREAKIGDEIRQCRAKKKLSFSASPATDIFSE